MSEITLESLLPKRKSEKPIKGGSCKGYLCADLQIGYNQALSDCLTALQQAQAKGELIIVQEGEQWVKLPSENDIKKLVEKFILEKPIGGDWDGTRAIFLNYKCIDSLAQAILALLRGCR